MLFLQKNKILVCHWVEKILLVHIKMMLQEIIIYTIQKLFFNVARIITLHNSKITLQSVRIIFIGWKLPTNLSLFVIPVTTAVPVQALYLGLLIDRPLLPYITVIHPVDGALVGAGSVWSHCSSNWSRHCRFFFLFKWLSFLRFPIFSKRFINCPYCSCAVQRESCIWTLLFLSLEFSFRLSLMSGCFNPVCSFPWNSHSVSPSWVLVSILFVALVACPVCVSKSILHKVLSLHVLYPDVEIFWIDLRQAPLVFCFSL